MRRNEDELSLSASQHLMAIARLRSARGYARVSDVARQLGITRGSASLTLKSLKQKGFVAEDENRFLVLTDKGHGVAEKGLEKQALLHRFLEDVLLCAPEQAAAESVLLAHPVSSEVAAKLGEFMSLLQSKEGERLRAAWVDANKD